MRIPTGDAVVASTEFGPYFFDDHQPNLVFTWPGEHWLVVLLEHGEVVIDEHFLCNSSNTYPSSEYAAWIDLTICKDVLDSLWVFCERSQRRHEVAVTEVALHDVHWIDRTNENRCLNNLGEPFPNYFLLAWIVIMAK